MALGLIQGALGQPFASAVEGPAFAVLNEILGAYHTDGGFGLVMKLFFKSIWWF